MKKYTLFILFLVLIQFTARSQKETMIYMYFFTFDDSTYSYNITLDPSNPYNDWQVGQPQKALFNQAYSSPNVLVTDTVGYYRPSDTSIFTFVTPTNHYGFWPVVEFYYKFDSDTLLDYGKIEVSKDNGHTWIDIIRSANLYGFSWYVQGQNGMFYPDSIYPFTGRTNGWNYFESDLFGFYNPTPPDTIMYRFSFISDAIQTNREGWMIDNLFFFDWWEGIGHTTGGFHASVSPNPVNSQITVHFINPSKDRISIELFDSKGVKQKELNTTSNHAIINVQSLSAGMYLYKIMNIKTQQLNTGRFIKQ